MFSSLGQHLISMRSSYLTKTFWIITAIFVCFGLFLTVQINFGQCHIKKFQIPKKQKGEPSVLQNLKWTAGETNSVDHVILKSVINMSKPIIKKFGACFLCTQKYVKINIVHVSTEAMYITTHLKIIQGILPNTQICTLTPPHIKFLLYFFCVQPLISKNAM